MKIYLIVFLTVALFTLHFKVRAHEDSTANHAGGPCWIWELTVTPYYCVFTDGTRVEHPLPDSEPAGT